MPDASPSLRKRARIITIFFYILSGLLSASWSSRIPDIQQQLGANNTLWGTILFALPLGFVTGIVVASWLIARYGSHRIIITACLAASILLIVLGGADTITQLSITLFFAGMVRTVFSVAANTRSVEVQQLYDRPILSLFHGMWSLACFVAMGIGTACIIFQVAPVLQFTGIAVFCIACALLLRKSPLKQGAVTITKRPLFVKPDKYLLLLGMITFNAMLCESTIFDWSVNYFDKVVKADKGLTTIGYTAFIISMAAGRLAGDQFIKNFGPFTLLKINGVLMASGFLVAAIFPYLLPAAIGFLLVGLGDSIIIPITYNLSSRQTKFPPSYALAAVTLIGYIGFLTGPILFGSLSDGFGMQWALAIVGCIFSSIYLLAVQVQKRLAPITGLYNTGEY